MLGLGEMEWSGGEVVLTSLLLACCNAQVSVAAAAAAAVREQCKLKESAYAA
jgi:hypothetical protein